MKTVRRGFTLIELLVVIGIIAVLAAMLLPVLSRAKGTAQRVQCVNNEKQLVTATFLYAISNNDKMPGNGRCRVPTIAVTNLFWVQGAMVNPPDNTNTLNLLDSRYAQYADFIKSANTYVCPADRDTAKVFGVNYPRIRSYEMNAYVGWDTAWDYRLDTNYMIFHKQSDFERAHMPDGTFVFIDVQSDSICWPFYGMMMASKYADYYFNFPSSAHNRGAVLAFADSHVEWHQWADGQTVAAKSAVGYHTHHEKSFTTGNQDLAWLRLHTTVADNSQFASGHIYGGGGIDGSGLGTGQYPGEQYFPPND